jgi:hypothetical protein
MLPVKLRDNDLLLQYAKQGYSYLKVVVVDMTIIQPRKDSYSCNRCVKGTKSVPEIYFINEEGKLCFRKNQGCDDSQFLR